MEHSGFRRKAGTREPRLSARDTKKILFSLKYFIDTQPKKGHQSYSSWEKNKLLSKLLERLQVISDCSVMEALQQGFIKQYDSFPPPGKTHFKCPSGFENRKWSVIRKISGQKARVAGIMVDNVFYIIFFDKNHKFWISELKNT